MPDKTTGKNKKIEERIDEIVKNAQDEQIDDPYGQPRYITGHATKVG